MRVRAVLLPDPPRRVPGHRWLGVALRTVHLLTFGVLVGSHVFAVEPSRLLPFLLATVASGFALMSLDLASACSWLFTGEGVSVLLKLLLLAIVPVLWEQRVVILMMIAGTAGVTSHMPPRFRHRVPLPLAAQNASERDAGSPLPSVGAASPTRLSVPFDEAGRIQRNERLHRARDVYRSSTTGYPAQSGAS